MFPPETTILICDDSDTMRENVRENLKTLGFKGILEAEDGQKAYMKLQTAYKSGSKIGLIISDWQMPNMTGIEFLKKVRLNAQWNNIPFVLLTSQNDMDRVIEAVVAGVSSYIIKPTEVNKLRDKLEKVWIQANSASKT